MKTFNEFWELLSPKAEYANRRKACFALWNELTENQQETLYNVISDKLSKGKFVDYNPLFAMKNNSHPLQGAGGQTLSYRDYYNRYGTTEEQDGWKRQYMPEKQTTIYVKQS